MRDDDTLLTGFVEDIAAGRRPPPSADEIAGYSTEVPSGPLGVAETARLFGLTPHTLRYYDSTGLVRVGRGPNGHRVYDRDALDDLLLVHRLRQSGMSIQATAEVARLMRDGGDAPGAVVRLRAHTGELRRRIAELQIALALTEHKVDLLEGDRPTTTRDEPDTPPVGARP